MYTTKASFDAAINRSGKKNAILTFRVIKRFKVLSKLYIKKSTNIYNIQDKYD